MNGFLVLLVYTMDDLPVFMADSEEKAMAVARSLGEMPTPYMRLKFGTDCRTPVCVKVVQFSDGFPIRVTTVRDFTKEAA